MEFAYPELGFVVEFPATPTHSKGIHRTVLVPQANADVYSLKTDTAWYIATVIDLRERAEEGSSLAIEVEFWMHYLGDVRGNSTARVEPGTRAVFGRQVTIDVRPGIKEDAPGQNPAAHKWYRDLTGHEIPEGSRLTYVIFFNKGRLYLVQGVNLPNPDGATGPEALRFANSVSFPGQVARPGAGAAPAAE
jgi:hypothetical protein